MTRAGEVTERREAGPWIVGRLSGYPRPEEPGKPRCRCVTVTPSGDVSREWWDRCPRAATAEDGLCDPCRDPSLRWGDEVENPCAAQWHAWLIPFESLAEADAAMV